MPDLTVIQSGKTLGDSEWQKFTLGLSNISVPELTTDIVMSNTELYAQPPCSVSKFKKDRSQVVTNDNSRINKEDKNRSGESEGDRHQEEQNVDSSHISKKPHKEGMVSLGPEEIALAPTQPVVNCAMSSFLGKEQLMDENESREDESHPEEELISQLSRRVTKRAYNSEGEPNGLELTARVRATKSLGARLDSTEKGGYCSGNNYAAPDSYNAKHKK